MSKGVFLVAQALAEVFICTTKVTFLTALAISNHLLGGYDVLY